MQTIYIYKKETLENIAQPVVSNFEEFELNPAQFYPGWNAKEMLYTTSLFTNPTVDKMSGQLREMSKNELYKAGRYILAENEIVESGKIKTVELGECEYIEDNQIKMDRGKKIELIRKELSELKVEYSEKTFIFKEQYLQKSREVGDQNRLNDKVTTLIVTKQNEIRDWKVIDKDTGKDVYLTLTLQDALLMADMMSQQVTKAMKIETALKEKLETLSDGELKGFKTREEYEALWNA